ALNQDGSTRTFMRITATLVLFILHALVFRALAQEPLQISASEYAQMKENGTLPMDQQIDIISDVPIISSSTTGGNIAADLAKRGANSGCDLWQDPTPCTLGPPIGDDTSSDYIPLPFQFILYGTFYNGL